MATINRVFILPRRGLVGGQPVGADYMAAILERARKMDRACRERDDRPATGDERQMALPFAAKETV